MCVCMFMSMLVCHGVHACASVFALVHIIVLDSIKSFFYKIASAVLAGYITVHVKKNKHPIYNDVSF